MIASALYFKKTRLKLGAKKERLSLLNRSAPKESMLYKRIEFKE